jgi:hypothetical protein
VRLVLAIRGTIGSSGLVLLQAVSERLIFSISQIEERLLDFLLVRLSVLVNSLDISEFIIFDTSGGLCGVPPFVFSLEINTQGVKYYEIPSVGRLI